MQECRSPVIHPAQALLAFSLDLVPPAHELGQRIREFFPGLLIQRETASVQMSVGAIEVTECRRLVDRSLDVTVRRANHRTPDDRGCVGPDAIAHLCDADGFAVVLDRAAARILLYELDRLSWGQGVEVIAHRCERGAQLVRQSRGAGAPLLEYAENACATRGAVR